MSYYEQFHKHVKSLAKESDSTILRELELLKNNPLISTNEKKVIGEYLLGYMPKKKALKFGEAVAAVTTAPVVAAPVAAVSQPAVSQPVAPTTTTSQPALQGNLPLNYSQTAQAVTQAQQALQGLLNTATQTSAAQQGITGFGKKRKRRIY